MKLRQDIYYYYYYYYNEYFSIDSKLGNSNQNFIHFIDFYKKLKYL